MGTWIDDHNPSPAVRARLAELESEWRQSESDKMLGRIDEIEYAIDETVRQK